MAGATLGLAVLAPAAAHAAVAGWSGTLYPGAPRQCIGASAQYLANVSGTASGTGAHFVVLLNGAQVADTGTGINGYAATFTTPGFYQFCARDPQTATSAIYANISVRTDRNAG